MSPINERKRTLNVLSVSDVIAARMYVRDMARALGMHLGDQARISLAASSLANGLGLGKTRQGQIEMSCIRNNSRTGIQVICTRSGTPCTLEPGAIGDTRWMVDELTVDEQPPDSLQVTLVKWLA